MRAGIIDVGVFFRQCLSVVGIFFKVALFVWLIFLTPGTVR